MNCHCTRLGCLSLCVERSCKIDHATLSHFWQHRFTSRFVVRLTRAAAIYSPTRRRDLCEFASFVRNAKRSGRKIVRPTATSSQLIVTTTPPVLFVTRRICEIVTYRKNQLDQITDSKGKNWLRHCNATNIRLTAMWQVECALSRSALLPHWTYACMCRMICVPFCLFDVLVAMFGLRPSQIR